MMGRYGAGSGMNQQMGRAGSGSPGIGMAPQMGMGGWGFPGFGMSPQMGMGFSPTAAGMLCQACGMPAMGMGASPMMGMTGGGFWPGYAMMGAPYAGYWTPGYGWGYPGPTYGGTYTGYFTSTYGMASDDQIRGLVYDAIDADPTIPPGVEINVDVKDGIVTLSGTVPSKRIKHSVGDTAWYLPAVTDVNNNIQVTPRRRGEGTPRGRTSEPTTQRPTGR
ncbi:MAG: BON domain-containing protein [Chloroflexota bacterium]|nr:MAG: BON domain-containing protein [Chloroflexota bacterium]